MTDDPSLALAAELSALTPTALREADIAHLRYLLLDHCGVVLGGTHRPWISSLIHWATKFDGSGKAVVPGTDRRAAANIAALVAGAAAHSFELDDTHDASMSHPGAVVFSAALAVGAEHESSDLEIFAAIAAGYEAIARIGRAANAARVLGEGFHPTPLFGVFGAVAAAVKLLGGNAGEIACAWGHALSLAAGSMQFSQVSRGAEIKRMHAGYAAHHGVMAAELAMQGIDAPRDALHGRFGFLNLYGKVPDVSRLTEKRPLAIHEISLKPYACCRVLHSAVDGLRELMGADGLDAEAVRSITVNGTSKLKEQHMLRRPETPMAAQYSLPFTIGAAIALGPERFDAFDDDNLSLPEILGWADKVEVGFDAQMQEAYPEHFGNEVVITTRGGETRRVRVLDSVGTPERPMGIEQVETKVRSLIALAHPGYDPGGVLEAARNFGASSGSFVDRLGDAGGIVR